MVPDDEHRSSAICGELLSALERARTQLAIAVAAEAKITTLENRLRYVQTEERVRRSVKRLRRGIVLRTARLHIWSLALRALQRFPPEFEGGRESRSQRMCRCLLDVVATIEPDLEITGWVPSSDREEKPEAVSKKPEERLGVRD
jgi:hypothetical protein